MSRRHHAHPVFRLVAKEVERRPLWAVKLHRRDARREVAVVERLGDGATVKRAIRLGKHGSLSGKGQRAVERPLPEHIHCIHVPRIGKLPRALSLPVHNALPY